jgi:RsiW-degrading membrane proteinase PrsW (M82 family)
MELLRAVPMRPIMHKALENFLFGLAFGMGFAVAANVLNFLGQFIHAR